MRDLVPELGDGMVPDAADPAAPPPLGPPVESLPAPRPIAPSAMLGTPVAPTNE